MTLPADSKLQSFLNSLVQFPFNSSSAIAYDKTDQNNTQPIEAFKLHKNIDILKQDPTFNIISSTSIIVDSLIFEKLSSYLENGVDYNDTSFLSSLLFCKLIQFKLTQNYKNSSTSYENNAELVSTYLSIYTSINPDSSMLTFSAGIANASNLLSTVDDNSKLLPFLDSSYLEQSKNYIYNICNKFDFSLTGKKISKYDFKDLVSEIKPEDELYTLFYLKDIDKCKELLPKLFGNINIQTLSKEDIENILSNTLLIIIAKAIQDKKHKWFIQLLAYVYLISFSAQWGPDNEGICYVLSTIFVRNALSRFNHTHITNIIELREAYFNQFRPIIATCPFIDFNEPTDENFIKTKENELKLNNPFYQMIFNDYDVDMIDFRNGYDDQDSAILYLLKRERAFFKFLREQFKNRESEIQVKYDECCDLIIESGFETPFKLKDDLFVLYCNKIRDVARFLFSYDTPEKLNEQPDGSGASYLCRQRNWENELININKGYKLYDDPLQYSQYLLMNPNISYVSTIINCLMGAINEDNKGDEAYLPGKFYTSGGYINLNHMFTEYNHMFVEEGYQQFMKEHNIERNSFKNIFEKYKGKKKYYCTIDYGPYSLIMSTMMANVFADYVEAKTNCDEAMYFTLKNTADLIASFLAGEWIHKDNRKNNLAVYLIVISKTDENLHSMCEIINDGERFIYDPNLVINGIDDDKNKYPFSFIWYNKKWFEEYNLLERDWFRDYILSENTLKIQNYPRLVKFLGGSKNELIKLLLWLLIGVIVVVAVIVIVKCVRRSKCGCVNSYNDA